MTMSGDNARTILTLRQASSMPAAEGSDQSTSKKLFPSVGPACTSSGKMDRSA
eukprot:CAMPEP_0181432274 /NCGR_PEP_ID=MMETSP1110-20121109/18682_1 /TAXON_ID=174948 /ORGANISM="Symbiodinium sp., Strain CCMP421" /LENGTH=52 /DNA_ID=CAMNT_0023555671 /DNA_START=143 /DNA_END=301 /DNA_ORIENTATION=+